MKLKKLTSLFILGALLMTGCQSSGSDESSKETAQIVEEKTVVAATVSGTQVLDKLDANVIGIPTTKLEKKNYILVGATQNIFCGKNIL